MQSFFYLQQRKSHKTTVTHGKLPKLTADHTTTWFMCLTKTFEGMSMIFVEFN